MEPMDINGRTVLVAGLGVSGRGMADVLRGCGAHPLTVDERNPDADLHDFDAIDWEGVDLVATSPVFAPTTPRGRRRGSASPAPTARRPPPR